MALARAPERAPEHAPAEQPSEPTDTPVRDAEAKETRAERDYSPRRKLATLVSKLSESEAEEVLAMVMQWRAKR
jgi:hypothetical protein